MSSLLTEYWTLEEALILVRKLQPETRQFDYHLTLGGGVLNKGESKKDLDLFFLPMENGKAKSDPDRLLGWLKSLWGEGATFESAHQPKYRVERLDGGMMTIVVEESLNSYNNENSPYKYKHKFDYSGLRIDVFILKADETWREKEIEIKKEAFEIPF